MEDKNRKEEEQTAGIVDQKNRAETKKFRVSTVAIIIGLVLFAISIAIDFDAHVLERKKWKSEQQERAIEKQEEEEKRRPQMEASAGAAVVSGVEKYQTVHILNTNADVVIKNGVLVVDCRMEGKNKDGGISVNFRLDGAVCDNEVEYLEELDGSIVLLRKDYQKFEKEIESYLKDQGITVAEGMIFQTYLFIYCEYTCGKEELKGYYRINIGRHGFGVVEEIKEPEKYFHVHEIKL